MQEEKFVLLEKLMWEFLDHKIVADGFDGYYSDTMGKEMARAAENVYDSCMNIQEYMRYEGLEP